MPNTWRLPSLEPDDVEAVRAIFNYYVEHSFAAYPLRPLSKDAIQDLLASCRGYPALAAVDEAANLIGFGFLRPYNPHGAFAGTAMIAYFIVSEYTGKGLGTALLHRLEARAREQGITHLLAHVSSRNEGSLMFHRKHGFRQCGCFHDIGYKNGTTFNVVWFEKTISSSSRGDS